MLCCGRCATACRSTRRRISGAQLPLLVRGLYYAEWHPAGGIRKDRHQEDFLAHVAEALNDTRPVNTKEAVRTVFRVLDQHIAAGQARKVASSLPAEIRILWPSGKAPADEDSPETAPELENAMSAKR